MENQPRTILKTGIRWKGRSIETLSQPQAMQMIESMVLQIQKMRAAIEDTLKSEMISEHSAVGLILKEALK